MPLTTRGGVGTWAFQKAWMNSAYGDWKRARILPMERVGGSLNQIRTAGKSSITVNMDLTNIPVRSSERSVIHQKRERVINKARRA